MSHACDAAASGSGRTRTIPAFESESARCTFTQGRATKARNTAMVCCDAEGVHPLGFLYYCSERTIWRRLQHRALHESSFLLSPTRRQARPDEKHCECNRCDSTNERTATWRHPSVPQRCLTRAEACFPWSIAAVIGRGGLSGPPPGLSKETSSQRPLSSELEDLHPRACQRIGRHWNSRVMHSKRNTARFCCRCYRVAAVPCPAPPPRSPVLCPPSPLAASTMPSTSSTISSSSPCGRMTTSA